MSLFLQAMCGCNNMCQWTKQLKRGVTKLGIGLGDNRFFPT